MHIPTLRFHCTLATAFCVRNALFSPSSFPSPSLPNYIESFLFPSFPHLSWDEEAAYCGCNFSFLSFLPSVIFLHFGSCKKGSRLGREGGEGREDESQGRNQKICCFLVKEEEEGCWKVVLRAGGGGVVTTRRVCSAPPWKSRRGDA